MAQVDEPIYDVAHFSHIELLTRAQRKASAFSHLVSVAYRCGTPGVPRHSLAESGR